MNKASGIPNSIQDDSENFAPALARSFGSTVSQDVTVPGDPDLWDTEVPRKKDETEVELKKIFSIFLEPSKLVLFDTL